MAGLNSYDKIIIVWQVSVLLGQVIGNQPATPADISNDEILTECTFNNDCLDEKICNKGTCQGLQSLVFHESETYNEFKNSNASSVEMPNLPCASKYCTPTHCKKG